MKDVCVGYTNHISIIDHPPQSMFLWTFCYPTAEPEEGVVLSAALPAFGHKTYGDSEIL